jgi:predicted metal-binding membrane protein
MTEWRDGTGGALTMGMRHGGFCLGCCWALMILLFAFGVMNLPWAAALAVIVAVEKVAPWGDILSRAIGGLLAASGAAVVLSALL